MRSEKLLYYMRDLFKWDKEEAYFFKKIKKFLPVFFLFNWKQARRLKTINYGRLKPQNRTQEISEGREDNQFEATYYPYKKKRVTNQCATVLKSHLTKTIQNPEEANKTLISLTINATSQGGGFEDWYRPTTSLQFEKMKLAEMHLLPKSFKNGLCVSCLLHITSDVSYGLVKPLQYINIATHQVL